MRVVEVESGSASRSMRVVNIVLGVWLFISAFIWPHTLAQMTNTWILGVICVVVAFIATSVPWIRYVNTALAVWLFISAFALPTEAIGTTWNNAIVGILVFIFSLMPMGPAISAPATHLPHTP